MGACWRLGGYSESGTDSHVIRRVRWEPRIGEFAVSLDMGWRLGDGCRVVSPVTSVLGQHGESYPYATSARSVWGPSR